MDCVERSAILAGTATTKLVLNVEEQRELFIWKYRDIERSAVNELYEDFKKFDKDSLGEIGETDAMRMLEARGATKTATELRSLFTDIDRDRNRRISFLEWCCAYFQQSYEDLSTFADEAARDLARAEARDMELQALAAEEEIKRAREEEEAEKKKKAEELEAESRLTGVAGMAAFFKRQVEGAQDVTQTNEQKIREEAARRRALREAKALHNKALEEAMRIKTAEDIQKEVQKKALREAANAAALVAQREAEEKRIRAERKAANEAKWGGGLPPPSPANLKRVTK